MSCGTFLLLSAVLSGSVQAWTDQGNMKKFGGQKGPFCLSQTEVYRMSSLQMTILNREVTLMMMMMMMMMMMIHWNGGGTRLSNTHLGHLHLLNAAPKNCPPPELWVSSGCLELVEPPAVCALTDQNASKNDSLRF